MIASHPITLQVRTKYHTVRVGKRMGGGMLLHSESHRPGQKVRIGNVFLLLSVVFLS